LDTKLITAGSEIAVHEIKKNDPMKTATHVGIKITMRYPPIAIAVNTMRARLYPSLSLRYPPGKEYNALNRLSKAFNAPTAKTLPPRANR